MCFLKPSGYYCKFTCSYNYTDREILCTSYSVSLTNSSLQNYSTILQPEYQHLYNLPFFFISPILLVFVWLCHSVSNFITCESMHPRPRQNTELFHCHKDSSCYSFKTKHPAPIHPLP